MTKFYVTAYATVSAVFVVTGEADDSPLEVWQRYKEMKPEDLATIIMGQGNKVWTAVITEVEKT